MKKEEFRIRKRQTYKMWKNLIKFLNENPNKIEILKRIYSILDSRRAWGSYQHSDWAYESLEQALKDDEKIFLDSVWEDVEKVMKNHGFSQISEQHDNRSMVLHFYNEERDILFIIEEQQHPNKELLEEDYGVVI